MPTVPPELMQNMMPLAEPKEVVALLGDDLDKDVTETPGRITARSITNEQWPQITSKHNGHGNTTLFPILL